MTEGITWGIAPIGWRNDDMLQAFKEQRLVDFFQIRKY